MIDFFIAHFNDILPFILIGFGAQIIDGALGMAYGVISSTLLLALGVPPSRASASVHAAETFTTGVSAISHILHRNVDWKLFARLIIPGVVGGVTGAYLLTHIDGSFIKPFIQAYLTAIGLYLIWRGFHFPPHKRDPKWVTPLGLFGGFLDATGGGGLGSRSHVQPVDSRVQSAPHDRHGQHRGIHSDDLDQPDLPVPSGLGDIHHLYRRIADRRCGCRAIWSDARPPCRP